MPLLRIEVVYALPDRQTVLACDVAEGMTVGQSVISSGILEQHPEIDLENADFGLWNERVAQDCLVRDGDRVEIYRPLIADPKQIRRKQARDARKR
ncbi:MAG: RnfH family protein [Betaproteobacteria bacterium]|jgi:putative ubiquitin-RnfH superfamily antitoxin RatB of RatAB toxin-antitoxin module|nr:MAG: RnfH family protein [Betaproteobacteria bacterium]